MLYNQSNLFHSYQVGLGAEENIDDENLFHVIPFLIVYSIEHGFIKPIKDGQNITK